MYVSPDIFFLRVNNLDFIFALLILVQHHFPFTIIIYIIMFLILFFINTTNHWRMIQQMNSNGMVYPYPLITFWLCDRVIIKLPFFVSYSLVTTVEV